MSRLIPAAVMVAATITASDKVPLPRIDPALRHDLVTYVERHYQTPEDYVVSKFKDHDVVFLGEAHRVKQDVELVQALIPRLYRAGVFTLCTEFARREDQPLIDRLLAADSYDEALAREITFRELAPWGYQEYVDIYRVAWRLNHELPKGANRFRILGLNSSPDWSVLQRPEDWENPELRKKVWGPHGGEDEWAKVILDDVVARNGKALVYCGSHHAFTVYRQPSFDEKTQKLIRLTDDRMGNYVFHAIGKRAITVRLHFAWPPATGYGGQYVYAVDGVIDAVIHALPARFRHAGFDTTGTPFGKLAATNTVYKWGYDPFTLEKLCDGYVIQGTLSEIEGVTPIKDFINAGNIERARQMFPNPEFRHASVEELLAGIAHDARVPVIICKNLQ